MLHIRGFHGARAAVLLSVPLALVPSAALRAGDEPSTKRESDGHSARPAGKHLDKFVINPPDVLQIEMLQALPGRPITGEYVVRPDGTVSLGYYGDIPVAGLTLAEIKEKVILHLRKKFTDEALGLWSYNLDPDPLLAKEAKARLESKYFKELQPPLGTPPSMDDLDAEDIPSVPSVPLPVRNLFDLRQADDGAPAPRASEATPDKKPVKQRGVWCPVYPKDSDYVLVNIAELRSAAYYVEGEVVFPCRRTINGSDTVLDALHYAGGPSWAAARDQIRLIRAGEAGKPDVVMPIHYTAIVSGMDSSTNYPMQPGDRLFVPGDSQKLERINHEPVDALMAKWLQTIGLRIDTVDNQLLDLSRKLSQVTDSSRVTERQVSETVNVSLAPVLEAINAARAETQANPAAWQVVAKELAATKTDVQALSQKLDQVVEAAKSRPDADSKALSTALQEVSAALKRIEAKSAEGASPKARKRSREQRGGDALESRLDDLQRQLDALRRAERRSRSEPRLSPQRRGRNR